MVFDSRQTRDAICAALADAGVYARKYFYPLITDFACYRDLPGFETAKLPVAKRLSDGVVTLPMYPDLADEEIELICGVIREALSK